MFPATQTRYISYSSHSGGENEQFFCWDTIGYSIPPCSDRVAHLYPSAIHFLFLLLHREQSGSCRNVLRLTSPTCSTLGALYIIPVLPNISASTILPINQGLPHGHATTAEFFYTICMYVQCYFPNMPSHIHPESSSQHLHIAGTFPYLTCQHLLSIRCYDMGMLTRLISSTSMKNS